MHGDRRHPRVHLAPGHGHPQPVILIDQIETEIANGRHRWDAVIVATEHRLRPILLTAAAAILGMIPIAPTVFWGPMAYAVIGGLAVATLLTLVFLPALYVAWFRIQPAQSRSGNSSPSRDPESKASKIVSRLKAMSNPEPALHAP